MEGTMRYIANYLLLSPISFLDRAASISGGRTSVIYGEVHYTWLQTRERCLRLASALSHLGLSLQDVVAGLAPNVPALCELYFGVPMAGAVLCELNMYFDSQMLAMALEKTRPKVFSVDSEFLSVAEEALNLLTYEQPCIIIITANSSEDPNNIQYEDFVSSGNSSFEPIRPVDEFDLITLNLFTYEQSRIITIATNSLEDPVYDTNFGYLEWIISKYFMIY